MISASLDRAQVIVGGTVRVSGSWQSQKPPRAVRIELRWETEGRGTTDGESVDSSVLDSSHGTLPPVFDTQLQVPSHGPASYDGSLIRVRWFVRVRLDVPWAGDPKEDLPLLVLPALIDG